jgi:hypothetical protein
MKPFGLLVSELSIVGRCNRLVRLWNRLPRMLGLLLSGLALLQSGLALLLGSLALLQSGLALLQSSLALLQSGLALLLGGCVLPLQPTHGHYQCQKQRTDKNSAHFSPPPTVLIANKSPNIFARMMARANPVSYGNQFSEDLRKKVQVSRRAQD